MNIKYKILFTINALLAVVILTFAFLIYASQKHELLKEINSKYQNVLFSLARVTQESVLSEDDISLISYTLSLKKTVPELEFAYAQNSEHILAHTDKKMIRAKPLKKQKELKNLIIFRKKEKISGRVYEILAGFSKRKTQKKLEKALNFIISRILKFAFVAFAAGGMLALWLAQIFTTPIKKLRNAFEEVGGGKLDVHLNDRGRKDEIGDLSRGFNKMVTRLKELDEMKKDFVSSVTHELKSPLSAIESYLNLMLYQINQVPKGDLLKSKFSKFEENINFIRQNSQRLINFITALLDTSKIEKGKFEIVKKECAPQSLIEDIVRLFEEKAKALNIKLEAEFQLFVDKVFLDPERMRQVLTNLISNALKFTPEGGKITIRTFSENGFLKISVSDTGRGIPKKEMEKMFKKFSQGTGKSPHANIVKGTGLGLYIAKAIVEAHGGSITVSSEEGKGTQFTLKIPM